MAEFDPSKPYETLDAPAKFDPTQPYEDLSPTESEQDRPKIPQAFIDRLRAGFEAQQAAKQAGVRRGAGTGQVEPEGMTDAINAVIQGAKALGLRYFQPSEVPKTGNIPIDILQGGFEAGVSRPFSAAQVGAHAAIEALGERFDPALRQAGLLPTSRLARDLPMLMESEMGRAGGDFIFAPGVREGLQFSRMTAAGPQRVGTLPTNQDFSDAATVLTGKPESFTAFHGSPNAFTEFAGEGVDVTTDRQMAERYRQPRGQPSKGQGNLYQVEVGAPQDAFLNLDRPLSQQSDRVKEALGKLGVTADDRLGMDAWDALRDAGDARTAAETLRSAGLAGTSRAIGTYSVFDKNLAQITHRNGNSIAEENLRDLWDQRGIHPAEAVHDAQSDAFLKKELTTPNPDPTDHSNIILPRGSPIFEGTPRTEIAKTGEQHIDAVLDSATTNRNIDNPVIVDNYDVPYGAGGSVPLEDPQVFIDRRFPRSMEVSGVTFDPADPFTIHENIEQHVMELLTKGGMDNATAYKVAHHEWAEKAEGAWYRAHGIDQAEAEKAYQPYLDQIEHENPRNPPPNLYEKPYPHQDVRSAEAGPVPEPTKAEIARAKEIVQQALERGDLARDSSLVANENLRSDVFEKLDAIKKIIESKDFRPTLTDGRMKFKSLNAEENRALNRIGFGRAEGVTYEQESNRFTAAAAWEKNLRYWQGLLEQTRGEIPQIKPKRFNRYGLIEEDIAARKDVANDLGETPTHVGADITQPEKLPTIVYHGTNQAFAEVDPAFAKNKYEQATFFTDDKNEASKYGNRTIAATLDPRHGLYVDKAMFDFFARRGDPVRKAIDYAKAQYQDYVVFDLGGPKTYAVFNKEAIKPANEAPTPVGADITRPENLPTLDEQPPPAAGSLAASARDAIGKLFGLGRNIQYLLDPMATGSSRAMVIAKDAANAVRRIDWEWMRLDQEIMRRFTPEQQTRMWNAGDEESVGRQLGEDMTHQGWATLTAEERQWAEYMDGQAQRAWLNAVDAGLVEGEGLPAYMPRMLLNVAAAESKSPRALNELGRNVFTRTSQMLHREYTMAEETEAAMRARFGDEAGIARNVRALPLATAKLEKAVIWKTMINQIEEIGKATGTDTVADAKMGEGWFTIAGHPAFTKWKPDLEQNPVNGKWTARTDGAGNTIFKPTSIWISPEFKGPLRSILDEPSDKFKVVPGAPTAYSALMTLKGKAMTAILNSPLIHNEVVWGKVMEAAGGREWLGFGLYFRGNRVVNNPARAGELIERGLNPIGPRGAIQDITAMMEQPSMEAGRSWTSQLLAAVPGMFDPVAGEAVKRAIDRAGDFYHNTLLWDRVRDVQFGLADHLSDRLVNQGVRRDAADRIAAHFSNIIVGSIPKESMSAGAQAFANLALFSRSFTLGNLSTFKQAFTGLPKPVIAQIERDFSLGVGPNGEYVQTPGTEAALQSAKSIARRKAMSTIAMSAGLFYIGNALFQHAFNIARNDSSLEQEINGYAQRYHDLMREAADSPSVLINTIGRLSPTWNNEPQKSDRVHIGYDQDGTAIYGRLPFGKFGEEMIGYPTMPFEMLKRKLNPQVAAAWEAIENDKGFGRKIYDDTNKTPLGIVKNAFAVAKHMVIRELPEGQITAASDLLRGEGDKTVEALRVFGPMAGFTASVGAPGGMAKGEQLAAKQSFETRFNLAWPDIKKQIRNGDLNAATQAMMDLGVPMKMQRGLMRAAMMPGNLSGRTLQDFFQYATPEQQNRMLNAR